MPCPSYFFWFQEFWIDHLRSVSNVSALVGLDDEVSQIKENWQTSTGPEERIIGTKDPPHKKEAPVRKVVGGKWPKFSASSSFSTAASTTASTTGSTTGHKACLKDLVRMRIFA